MKRRKRPDLSERNFKHGLTGTREYIAWQLMKRRCSNPKDSRYRYYGGRGIRVCKRWLNSFPNFLKDMGKKPTKEHTLERKNSNKNYTPKNCCWATWIEQAASRRLRCDAILYKGKRKTLWDWCLHFNKNYQAVWRRINTAGWDFERAMTTPIRPRRNLTRGSTYGLRRRTK